MENEKRLIDANALISNLRAFKGLGAMVAGTLVRFTEKQPTVDAVEVVHGRWIGDRGDYVCSLCGEEAPNDGYYPAPYCYGCGAKMDGGESS